jgi:antitoxin component HigA of HigAB toxin-antitoxin module
MQNKLRSIETELDYQNALEESEKLFDVEPT